MQFLKNLAALGLSVVLLMSSIFAQDEAPARTVFNNVAVWDGMADELQTGMNVLIEGNKVASISAEAINADGATVIDGNGRTLMPGLIDMHTHIAFKQGIPDHETKWGATASGA